MRFQTLRPRERQVAKLVAQHFTAGEIGEQLGISERTVRGYIETIGRAVPGQGVPMRRIAAWVRAQGVLAEAEPAKGSE